MKQKLMLIAGGLAAAAVVFYLARTSPKPSPQATQGAIGASLPTASVCVRPVTNHADKAVNMEGMDESLVGELRKTGLSSDTAAVGGDACGSFVYTEILDAGGKSKGHAELEFRLVLKGEDPPKLSSTAKGKSEPLPHIETADSKPASSQAYVVAKATPAEAQRQAIVAAFSDEARQIALAYRTGRVTRASAQ